MAGLAAAWRLSEPGWTDDYASITVYQRGWRLGGKGASSRGPHGRIEEHGLHVWLGYYENAFRLMRECYGELDRARSDPGCPIRTWRDAFIPASDVGLQDRHRGVWEHWLGHLTENDELPGEPDAPGGPMTAVEFVRRGLQLIRDFASADVGLVPPSGRVTMSPDSRPVAGRGAAAQGLSLLALIAAAEGAALGLELLGNRAEPEAAAGLANLASSLRDELRARADIDAEFRHTWHLLAVTTAIIRGLIADGVLTDPRGLASLNGEDFRDWVARHGAPAEALDATFMHGLYDLVFGHQDADPTRSGFGAGLAVFLTGKTFFEYKGAIFWKMTAGMGDIVFAPLYEALRRRGVRFEFFHRVDRLVPAEAGDAIESVILGRQANLAPGLPAYEPLVRVKGLPCFPNSALVSQLAADPAIGAEPLERHWCTWPDADTTVLRRGVDFDVLVLATSLAMNEIICADLVTARSEWRDLVLGVKTVATQAFQIWLREPESTLGWNRPGVTVSGFVEPFDTWASMPQTLPAESWPADLMPGSVAYFCNTLPAPWPPDRPWPEYASHWDARVRRNVIRFLEHDVHQLLPGVRKDGQFRWDLLCGLEANGHTGALRFDSQHWSANVDPSDRYVQSLPGTDRYRLRPDESGYENLYLAGDWTDCGLNAGCIEAAVLSGLQAANAIGRRSRWHRVAGSYLP
jgi:uncharacterized protein with NAD-binding domain and iron-sulfur cluster